MTLYVGETLVVIANIQDPITNAPIIAGTCTADFFAPPKLPATVPADRAIIDYTTPLTYNATTLTWSGTIITTAWAGGVWWLRLSIVGTYTAWIYQSFTLTA